MPSRSNSPRSSTRASPSSRSSTSPSSRSSTRASPSSRSSTSPSSRSSTRALSAPTFISIPDDLHGEIGKHLYTASLDALRATSKDLRRIVPQQNKRNRTWHSPEARKEWKIFKYIISIRKKHGGMSLADFNQYLDALILKYDWDESEQRDFLKLIAAQQDPFSQHFIIRSLLPELVPPA